MKQIDRRVRRTHRLLQGALLKLIEEKEFADITVEEVVERADVGRTTFYLHYRDKGHLLSESITFIAENMRNQQQPILSVFRHAEQNKALYMTILSGKGGVEALQRVHHDVGRLAQEVFELQIQTHNLNPVIAPEMMAHHFAGSLLSLVYWWLTQARSRHSAEEMTEQFHKLSMLGRAYGLGVDVTDVDLLRSLDNFAESLVLA